MPDSPLPPANEVQTLLDTLQSTIAGLQNAEKNLQDRHAEALSRLTEREARVTRLEEQLVAELSRVKGVSTDLAKAEARCEELISGVRRDVEAVTKVVESLTRESVEKLSDRFYSSTGELKGQVAAVQSRLGVVEAGLASVRNDTEQSRRAATEEAEKVRAKLGKLGERLKGVGLELAQRVGELETQAQKPLSQRKWF